jgi:hypothetical protein
MRRCLGGFLRSLAMLASLVGASVSLAQAADGCWFSDLRWSDDGESLLFLAGQGQEIRTLRYDLDTGNLTCIDPRVADPVWGAASGRVLFRDQFGIFESRVDSQHPPRMVVFLPEVSQHFLRDFGEDNRGQPMVWTYDRRAAQHSIVTLAPEGAFALPGTLPGAEARRAWQDRNQAQRFENAGGLYVRSSCFHRPRLKDQLCFENIGGSSSRRNPLFRITMGPPGGVEVIQNRCAPNAMVQSRDSTRVLLGVYEEVDRQGQSEVLSCWVADWEDARRVSETLLPQLVDVGERQKTWIHWVSPRRVLWVDVVGQLLSVEVDSAKATALVPLTEAVERSPVHRVVLGIANDLEEAQAMERQLEENGLDAGIQSVPRGYEVQVGAWADRQQAMQRADFLQDNGWPAAHVREGGIEMVAIGMGFEWLPRRSGEGVFVRLVQGISGTFAELWWAQPSQQPRRLIPSFEEFAPTLVNRR